MLHEKGPLVPRNSISILNFHGIGQPARMLEPGEDSYWISAALFAEIIDRVVFLRATWTIGITFDDGNASDAEIALPLLARHGLKASFFVLAGRIGVPGSLDRSALRELRREGMEIGNHGFDHLDWRSLDGPGRRREWVEARDIIAAEAGGDVVSAAIPFGQYNRSVLSGLAGCGYRRAYTSDRGPAKEHRWLQPRTSVTAGMSLDRLEADMRGDFSLARLRRMAGVAKRRLL